MTRLAEEVGLVGGDAVEHDGALVLLVRLRDEFVILAHAGKAEQAQAPREPSGEQGRLVRRKPDSGFAVDHGLVLGEEIGRDRNIARSDRDRSPARYSHRYSVAAVPCCLRRDHAPAASPSRGEADSVWRIASSLLLGCSESFNSNS